MNLTVNRLPSPTWNRLQMNRAVLDWACVWKHHIPKVLQQPDDILWQPCLSPKDSTLPAAIPGDLDSLSEELSLSYAQTAPHVQMKSPFILSYRYENEEQGLSQLVLHAGESSRMQVILLLESESARCTSALQIKVSADQNATVDLYVAELLGEEALACHQIAGVCGEQASIQLTKLELGGKAVYAGTQIDLVGKESDFSAAIGYHVKEKRLLDMNYVAQHHGKNSHTDIEVSGTLENNSKKIFRGTIDFQKGCAGAKGSENENVLLLGDTMVNQSIPVILCQEEDVEGNHGASIGRLDEKILFYLGSRGISEETAQEMIAKSKIEAISSRFPDETVQHTIHEFEQMRGLFHEA